MMLRAELVDGRLVVYLPVEVVAKPEPGSETFDSILTKREKEVLLMVSSGKVNKEIARELNLAERTVKYHVSSLLTKAGVRSRVELARMFEHEDSVRIKVNLHQAARRV